MLKHGKFGNVTMPRRAPSQSAEIDVLGHILVHDGHADYEHNVPNLWTCVTNHDGPVRLITNLLSQRQCTTGSYLPCHLVHSGN